MAIESLPSIYFVQNPVSGSRTTVIYYICVTDADFPLNTTSIIRLLNCRNLFLCRHLLVETNLNLTMSIGFSVFTT